MIYFYSELLTQKEMLLTYLLQSAPILIVYLSMLTYCFPNKFKNRIIVFIVLASIIFGDMFNIVIQNFFQDVLVIHNLLIIQYQFVMVMIFYFVFHRGERLFLINLLTMTLLVTLAANIFDYIRIFILNCGSTPFNSIFVVNWYFVLTLVLLPAVKKIMSLSKQRIQFSSTKILIGLWTVLIALFLFCTFVQVASISDASKHSGYTSVIYLSTSFIGSSFVQRLAPSAHFIIEPVTQVFSVGTIVMFFTTLVIGAFALLLLLNNRTRERLAQEKRTKYELTQYINTLETVTTNIRKNHHDFSNILFSLGGYIYQTPINEKELTTYFESVTQTFEEDYHYFVEISKLKNLAIPELKTLIFTKLMTATKRNITFEIEIEDQITDLPIDHLELSRIFGILIDNALEAALESNEPYVRLAIFEDREEYVFILVNSTNQKNVVSFVQQKNYTTKGEGHGLGLAIVKSIVQNYADSLTIKTSQKEYEFCQTLLFKKEAVLLTKSQAR